MNCRFSRAALLTWIAVCLVTLSGVGSAAAQDGSGAATPDSSATGIERTVAWLLPQQAADGGFVGFSGESDAGTTLDAIQALVAAETAGVDTGDSIDRAIAYLESGEVALVYVQTGAGQAAKLALGLSVAGVEPAGFAGIEPIALIEEGADPVTGLYGSGVFDHALAVMALVATGNEVPDAAIDAFMATQAENGGWAYDASTDAAMADSNTTAMSILALVAAGYGDSDAVGAGLAYLDSIQLEDGVPYSALPDTLADANSTALVVQAFVAAGRDPSSLVESLAAFQNADGAFYFNGADTSANLFATTAAIPALALLPFPIVDATPIASPAASPVSIHAPIAA